jgi:beta-aspartyl-dipeptidase (metallo-type)
VTGVAAGDGDRRGDGGVEAVLVKAARIGDGRHAVQDVLVVYGRIVALGPALDWPSAFGPPRVEDLEGRRLLPGLVDLHVHLAGGGGEGGFVNRTPAMTVGALARAGITTAVGLLGTDGVTRSVAGLLAHARAIAAEGITTRIFTGAYEVPTRTLTGSLRSDLVLVNDVVGTGEIAIADHRSSHPSVEEMAHLVAETRVGALLAGKPGLVQLHVGAGRWGLELLRRCVAEHDVPPHLLMPTHLNRNAALLDEAVEFLGRGGRADLTAGMAPDAADPDTVPAHTALARLLSRAGDRADLITVSSDAGGSAPTFDAAGHLMDIDVGRPEHLWLSIRRAVRQEGVPLADAAAAVTERPAQAIGLRRKGRLAVGADADLLALDDDLSLVWVMAQGRVVARDGEARVRGPFDPPLADLRPVPAQPPSPQN